jgi:hypothetical protein
MATYTICSNFVSSANSPCCYFKDVLLKFCQTNNLKVAVDAEGLILDAYRSIINGDKEYILLWLDLLANDPQKTIEKITIHSQTCTTLQDLFIAVCSNTFGNKKLICYSKQDYIGYEEKIEQSRINVIDRDDAILEVNSNGNTIIFANDSNIALNNSEITNK